MTLSAVVIDELARAMGVDLTDGLRAALHRIEVAEAEQVTLVTGAGDAGDGLGYATPASRLRAPSKAALRTRRWRAAKAAAARVLAGGVTVAAVAESVTRDVTEASPTVTEASPKASPVTVRDGAGDGVGQKEVPPTPPLRKTLLPQKGVSRRRKRHAVTVEPTGPVPRQIFLDEHDARFRELGVMRGRAYPVHSGGWWFDPFLVAKAEEVLASKVTRLRPSTAALNAAAIATGPPLARETG